MIKSLARNCRKTLLYRNPVCHSPGKPGEQRRRHRWAGTWWTRRMEPEAVGRQPSTAATTMRGCFGGNNGRSGRTFGTTTRGRRIVQYVSMEKRKVCSSFDSHAGTEATRERLRFWCRLCNPTSWLSLSGIMVLGEYLVQDPRWRGSQLGHMRLGQGWKGISARGTLGPSSSSRGNS